VRAHAAALEAALDGLVAGGAHVGEAHNAALPYVVIGLPGWGSPDELPLCGHDFTLDARLTVKAVAGTTEGCYAVLAKVRARLSPDMRWTPLAVEHRAAETKFVRAEFVAPDTSSTITSTDRHPVQGVDTYRLHSQPA
jgi:hypothetical protein